MSRKLKNRTKYKLKSSTHTRRHANNNKRKNDNRFVRFSEHFRQNCPLGTLEMALRASKFQNFLGEKTPRPAKPFTRSALNDSSVIEKYPDFTYSKGWTVWIRSFL